VKRFVSAVVSAAVVVGLGAVPTVPGATTNSEAGAAGKLRVTISEKGRVVPEPPRGTFVVGGTAGIDSGKTNVTPGEGRSGVRDGQRFRAVGGTDHLYGKKGELIIRFTGVTIDVADAADIEYGTWNIYTPFGTGMYESWRGGGRWAASSKGGRYLVRWEGLITK